MSDTPDSVNEDFRFNAEETLVQKAWDRNVAFDPEVFIEGEGPDETSDSPNGEDDES